MAKAPTNIKINNLATDEDIAKKFIATSVTEYERNKTLREQFEEEWKTADYMYKCAQNRTINSSEKTKGANDADDNRASLGSSLFHRQVNQMASQGVSVEASRPVPFKLEPIYNPGVYNSMEEGNSEAEQMNTLMKYTMKHDKYKKKSMDFWYTLCKYGSIPIAIHWNLKTKMVSVPEPQYEVIIDETTGQETAIHVSTTVSEQEVVTEAFPSVTTLGIDQLTADPYVGDIQGQTCVVVTSIVHKSDLLNEVNNGVYDKKAYDELSDKEIWDGDTASDFKKDLMSNDGKTYEENSVSDMYLKWDIYARVPIDGKKWDEDKNVPLWYYGVVIGNSIDSGKVMTILRNPDPDDEVPIAMINVYPDDPSSLYHVSPGNVSRSNYSVECTLKELAIDNMCLVNRPPLKVVDGMHRIKDFTFKRGQLWHVSDPNAVTWQDVRDNTVSTINMLEYIKQDQRTALSTDKNQMGESYGARTTAFEAQSINSMTAQPNLVWISYVLDQKLEFIAKKYVSYWKTFGSPKVIQQITDFPLIPDVYPSGMKGEFDILINIVGEYKEDMASSALIGDIVRMVAQAPQLLKSDTHEVDIGALMKDVFFKAGLNGDQYIKTPQGGDAARQAEWENIAIMQNSEQLQVNPDDNDRVHLQKHEGYRLKYSGIEDEFPQVKFLDMHIQQHKIQEQNEDQQNAAMAQQAMMGQDMGVQQ